MTACFLLSLKLCAQITGLQTHFGGVLDPHACFLLQRGMQTLPLRVAYQAETAHALATFLQDQPQVGMFE